MQQPSTPNVEEGRKNTGSGREQEQLKFRENTRDTPSVKVLCGFRLSFSLFLAQD